MWPRDPCGDRIRPGVQTKCISRRAISGREETIAWRWAAIGDAEAAMEPSCFGLAGGRAQRDRDRQAKTMSNGLRPSRD